jgi:sulfite reductase (NADPH) flavoprotein alpha-component
MINNSLLVLYGTETGNAEICANQAAQRLNAEGFSAAVKDMFDVPAAELQREQLVLICVSTHGEGDPPDAAVPLWESLVRGCQLDLSHLRYSVLALGDSSYKKFCQCGKDFDTALARQGAQRIAPRVDVDVHFEEPCAAWIEAVVTALKSSAAAPQAPACVTR